MAENSIVLRQGQAQRVQLEKLAAAAINPGNLIELTSANKFQKHSGDSADVSPVMFAIEDENQGNDIDDAYAADDRVIGWIPQRGDMVLAVLADGQNVAIGASLDSNGDGTLSAGTSNVVAIALEAMDLSDSSGAETEDTLLGYDKRIKVLIV